MSIRIQTAILVILGTAVASTSPTHAEWPEFRGPSGDGTAGNANLPTEWSRQQNVAWRTELPGKGWSSPVVIGSKIYLSAAVPQLFTELDSGFDLVLLIVEADSGVRLRQVTLFREGPDAPGSTRRTLGRAPPLCSTGSGCTCISGTTEPRAQRSTAN